MHEWSSNMAIPHDSSWKICKNILKILLLIKFEENLKKVILPLCSNKKLGEKVSWGGGGGAIELKVLLSFLPICSV